MRLRAVRVARTLPVVAVICGVTAAPAVAAELPPLDRPAIEDALRGAYDDVDASLSFLDRIWRILEDLVVRVLAAALQREGGLGLVIALAALALVAGGLWWAYRRFGVVGGAPPATVGATPPRDVDWALWAAHARERGDLEAAVRAGWRHLLHLLDQRGVVDDAPSLTASEAAAAAQRTGPALAAAVTAAADAFEHVVFADEPATSEHDRRVHDAVELVASR